jgi:hypothetical protein
VHWCFGGVESQVVPWPSTRYPSTAIGHQPPLDRYVRQTWSSTADHVAATLSAMARTASISAANLSNALTMSSRRHSRLSVNLPASLTVKWAASSAPFRPQWSKK